MQTEPQKSGVNVRTYFLQQGQSIGKLHEILDSSLLAGHLKRGLSIFIEIIFFLTFLLFLFVAVYIPTDPIQFSKSFSEKTTVTGSIHNDDVAAVMMVIKGIVFFASFMSLLLMLLLRRNRKKGALIHIAFVEVQEMKKRFDKAVKELPL